MPAIAEVISEVIAGMARSCAQKNIAASSLVFEMMIKPKKFTLVKP